MKKYLTVLQCLINNTLAQCNIVLSLFQENADPSSSGSEPSLPEEADDGNDDTIIEDDDDATKDASTNSDGFEISDEFQLDDPDQGNAMVL